MEVSGWYADEGLRWRAAEEGVYGIPLSDHSDFPSLVEFVRETSPRLVYAVYGFSEKFTRHLRRLGYRAYTKPGATGLAKILYDKHQSSARTLRGKSLLLTPI